MEIWVSDLCHFPSVWRTFNYFFKHFSQSLAEKVFISSSPLKDNFTGYRILVFPPSFNTLNILLHSSCLRGFSRVPGLWSSEALLSFFFLPLGDTERLEGTTLAQLLPHVRKGSGKVISLGGQAFVMENTACISKWLCFPSSCTQQGIFLWTSLWEPGEGVVPVGKTLENVGLPPRFVPQGFSTLQLVHTQPQAIHQNQHLSIPTDNWLQWLLPQVIRSLLWLSIFTSLHIWGWQFALWPPFSGSKKSHCFSVGSMFFWL